MRKLFTILFFLNLPGLFFAQACLPSGIILTTQTQVDNFVLAFPDCTTIEGSVTILYAEQDPIVELNGLSNITSIEGNLDISGHLLIDSLQGLENLQRITGNLRLHHNENLADLSVFNQIDTLGGLEIAFNPALEKLNGFNLLPSIQGNLRIESNATLAEIRGFDQLVSVGQNIRILENPQLTSIEGFSALVEIGQNLDISHNKSLLAVEDFEQLQWVGDSLQWANNDSLLALPAMPALDSIFGSLILTGLPMVEEFSFPNLAYIDYQLILSDLPIVAQLDGLASLQHLRQWFLLDLAMLSSIEGLAQVEPAFMQSLAIEDCPVLSACAIESVCTFLDLEIGQSSFANNGATCNEEQDILDLCFPLTTQEPFAANLHFFPNPNRGYLYWKGEGSATLQSLKIYDAIGRLILAEEQVTAPVRLPELPNGPLWLTAILEDQIFVQKIQFLTMD